MDSLEVALQAIDTMLAAMEQGNKALAQVLDVASGQADEIHELGKAQAALAQAFSDHLRLDIHGGTPGESVRVLRQP